MKQIAIIGPTASGKSDLALNIAQKTDAYILSIDSLSIYKEIDIISAKPTKEELSLIKHYGVDLLYPNEYFSVEIFLQLYKQVVKRCEQDGKNLIIVGGSSFYLKSLISGISLLPSITPEVQHNVKEQLYDLSRAYKKLQDIDPAKASTINPNDSYRIEKLLLIYEASKMAPSKWFETHPPEALNKNIKLFNIEVERDTLRQRIEKRTAKMISLGAIDEVCALEHKYSRAPHPMGAIGIVEILEYLDGKVSFNTMQENISIHTAQLAKRQQTFNRTQFADLISLPLEQLEKPTLQAIIQGHS